MPKENSTQDSRGSYPLRMPEATLSKIKYIAWYDRTNIKDTISKACEDAISKWEKKNGTITDDMIKKSGV